MQYFELMLDGELCFYFVDPLWINESPKVYSGFTTFSMNMQEKLKVFYLSLLLL
jgi:hypothetical protein